MNAAAIEFLREEIEREQEFQLSEESDGQGDPIPLMQSLLALLEAGQTLTAKELRIWGWSLFEVTQDGDFHSGVVETLTQALGLEYEEAEE